MNVPIKKEIRWIVDANDAATAKLHGETRKMYMKPEDYS